MKDIGVKQIFEHYKGILAGYCELLHSTQSFEQGIEQGFQGDDVMGFIKSRELGLAALKQKEAESITLRAAVCQELGLAEFTLNNLSTKISEYSLNALGEVIGESKRVIEEIQEIDTRLGRIIQMEIEATKLDLHRIQSANRLQHAYQTESIREARFIDKIK